MLRSFLPVIVSALTRHGTAKERAFIPGSGFKIKKPVLRINLRTRKIPAVPPQLPAFTTDPFRHGKNTLMPKCCNGHARRSLLGKTPLGAELAECIQTCLPHCLAPTDSSLKVLNTFYLFPVITFIEALFT